MAQRVTIEGSRVTPSDALGRGVRREVELTDRVRQLIAIGAVVVVGEAPPEAVVEKSDSGDDGDSPLSEAAEPHSDDTQNLEPPTLNASRQAWWDHLASKGIEVAPDATRDDLIEIWENHAD